MIDLERKILFVHIPKCAGTFIENNLTPDIDWHEKGEKHFSMQRCVDVYGEENVRECFRFTVVRNPFTRLLSFYLYHSRKGTELFAINALEKYTRAFRPEYYANFSDFVFNLTHYFHKLESWAKNDLMPCHKFLISHQGIGVDLLIRQERLKQDIGLITDRTGILLTQERVNAAPEAYNLCDYYHASERQFVLNFYREDFFHYYPGGRFDEF